MTVPIEGAAGQPRKTGRLVKVALTLSLALNIFFIAGLVYTKIVMEHWRGPPPLMTLANELNLTPDQHKTFRQFIQTVREHGKALRDANTKLGEQIWDELSKPQPDPAKIAQVFTQVADNRRDFQTAVSNALLPFLESLTADQRAKFIEIAKRHQDNVANRMRHLGLP
ncbi:MAG TPA: periplasmic heavy metal sensor [Stellaceae bacterium]|nr:periplasmic heavy metal sensor [Stellaceae bacterium]